MSIQLLAKRNRELATELAVTLAGQARGGLLIYGCEGSGRAELLQGICTKLWEMVGGLGPRLEVAVPSWPKEPLAFTRQLASRLGQLLTGAGLREDQEAFGHLQAVSTTSDLFLRLECLRDGIRSIPYRFRPAVMLFNVDCVVHSHGDLNEVFAGLRDPLVESGLFVFVTALDDSPRLTPGVSSFCNNFLRERPFPVDLEDVTAFLRDCDPPEGAIELAPLILRHFGMADGRVRQGLNRVSSLLGGRIHTVTDVAEEIPRIAVQHLLRHARRFLDRLDSQSQVGLQTAVRGLAVDPAQRELLRRHPWSQYSLRFEQTQRGHGAGFEIWDAGLREELERRYYDELASTSPERFQTAARGIAAVARSGVPDVAMQGIAELAGSARTDEQRDWLSRIGILARVNNAVLHREYDTAADALEAAEVDPELIASVVAQLRQGHKIVSQSNQDLWIRFGQGAIMQLLILEYARGRMRERLRRRSDAFDDYCKIFDALVTVLVGFGHQTSAPPPGDAVEHYARDLRKCNHVKAGISPPSVLPTVIHGPMEALYIARARDLANLRTLEIVQVQHVLRARSSTMHRPFVPKETDVAYMRGLVARVLRLISVYWGTEGLESDDPEPIPSRLSDRLTAP